MRRVRSPFVAEVLDADVTGEFPYIVTRYVPGPTLEAMVRSRGPLSGSGLRRLAYGTAEALTAIHAAGVVHRDLKPGNVMLTDDRPVVIDFGIAQSPDATRLTQTGLVMGTPGYLAPEVIEGQPSSPASDVHSWGATMAFAATGRAPFGGGGDSYQTHLLPHRLRPRRPVRRPRSARAAAVRGAGQGSGPPPACRLAERPGQRPGPGRGRPGGHRGRSAPDRRAHRADHGNGRRESARKAGQRKQESGQEPQAPGLSRAQAGRPRRRRPAAPGRLRPARAVPRAPHAALAPPAPSPRASRPTPSLAPAAAFRPNPGWPAPQRPKAPRALKAPSIPRAPNIPRAPSAPRSPTPNPRTRRSPRPQAGRATLAGLAIMIAAVALTLILPVAGLVVSLAVITLLRAADRAQSALAVRRSVRGPRASDLLVVVVTAPLTVARALLIEALMAPLAFAAGAVVYVATLALTGTWNCPGRRVRGRGRRRLVRRRPRLGPAAPAAEPDGGPLARTPLTAAVTALAVWALAAGAVIFAASQAPYYWPVMSPHLPALHGWPFIGSYLSG